MRNFSLLFNVSIGLSLIASNSFAQIDRDFTQENSYCAAIRGNGELMPAHWGSMAKLVERYGLPSAMAGGSSASITMFLLESIALNKIATTPIKQALLIKSIEGYIETLSQTQEGKALGSLLKDKETLAKLVQKLAATNGRPTDGATALELMAFKAKHLKDIEILMASSDLKAIINPEMQQYIQESIVLSEQFKTTQDPAIGAQVNYRYDQIQQAFNNFGKFNTQTDNTLFFRPGIVSFEKSAKLFGRMANFYAGYGLGKNNEVKQSVDSMMSNFLNVCSLQSIGKSWQEIVKAMPVCRQMLGKSVLDYRSEFKRQETNGVKLKYRVMENIGNHLATFPTTSIIVKNGVQKYLGAHKDYKVATEKTFGSKFKIHPSQYRFGYWGNTKELRTIENNFKKSSGFVDGRGQVINLSNDMKSMKFEALGDAPWLDALSTSPAEPGLARILPINNRSDVLSAGGWNDLHPTLVLRAVGCKNIMYVTRRGGDSMFGQGVVKKLAQIDGFDWSEWAGLSADQKRLKNAIGNSDDVGRNASSWSKLFNLSNPDSSFSKSLEYTDAVWCTNWDQQDTKTGMSAVVADGYNAPLYNRANNAFFRIGNGISKDEYESQLLLKSDQTQGSYQFSGCISNP